MKGPRYRSRFLGYEDRFVVQPMKSVNTLRRLSGSTSEYIFLPREGITTGRSARWSDGWAELSTMHVGSANPSAAGTGVEVVSETGFFTGTIGTSRSIADMPRQPKVLAAAWAPSELLEENPVERRQFIMVGGSVVAGAAVGAVGSSFGSGLATDGQLSAMASSRGLSGDEARAALQTTVPPGSYDPYYMFAFGGTWAPSRCASRRVGIRHY